MRMGHKLAQEVKTYEKNKFHLLKENRGKFVLIKEDCVISVFDTSTDAIKEGIDKFGNMPFLVRQILEIEQVQHFASHIIRILPCPQ